MSETTEYKGYLIELCFDETYDIMLDSELVDGTFKSIDEAKAYIDAE